MQAAETQVLALESFDAVNLLEGETALTDEVTAIATPGHTPGHMSLLVSSGGQKACLTGDAIVHPAQITEPDWAPRMDFEPDVASQTRHALLERFEAEGLTVVACHFPRPGFGQVVRLEGRRYWQAR
jgi:glyoxylase-like metal-dependent hydrolase (beta-lactamase superfamily II)